MSFKSIAEFLDPTNGHHPTTAERKLITDTQAGEICWLCDQNSPSLPAESTDETRIRARLLRLLITGGTPACGLHERGVTLFGGWVDGPLNLAYCEAKGQTVLRHCHFPEEPRFESARFHLLSLRNSAFPKGLFAQSARVAGSFFISGVTAKGTIDVNGAKIDGQLDCEGASLDGGKDAAEGQLEALNAQGLETGESLFLRRLSATGTVALIAAKIGGQLACAGAKLDGGKDAAGGQIKALNAQGIVIGQDLFLNHFSATGMVAVNGARIGGQLACTGAKLDGGKDKDGGLLVALNAQQLIVAASFVFRAVGRITGRIDLTSAHVGDLVDDVESWPTEPDQLLLGGFTYDRLAGTAPTTLAARRDWLAAGSQWEGEFRPQPYTQLARVLRQMGHAGEARKVLMEREDLLAQHRTAADRAEYQRALSGDPLERGDAGRVWLRMKGFQLWAWLTKAIAGYGYAPQRALYCSFVIVPLFALVYFLFWRLGAMVPTDAILLVSPEWAEAVAANPSAPSLAWQGPAQTHYETFYSLPYALDVFLPIVDLGQQSTWSQTTETWWGWGARLTTWVLQSLGYVVTSLGLAAATGIIQRNQPD